MYRSLAVLSLIGTEAREAEEVFSRKGLRGSIQFEVLFMVVPLRTVLRELEHGNYREQRKAVSEINIRRRLPYRVISVLLSVAESTKKENLRLACLAAIGNCLRLSQLKLMPKDRRVLEKFLQGTVGERGFAALALAHGGKVSRETLQNIIAATHDHDEMLRARAIMALGSMSQHRRAGIEALSRAMNHPDRSTRLSALRQLAKFTDSSKQARLGVEAALEDSSREVQYHALCVIQDAQKISPRVISPLVRILGSGGRSLSTYLAAQCLARFGDEVAISAIQNSWE